MLSVIHLFLLILLCLAVPFFTAPRLFLFSISYIFDKAKIYCKRCQSKRKYKPYTLVSFQEVSKLAIVIEYPNVSNVFILYTFVQHGIKLF